MADETLRAELERIDPTFSERVAARRTFLRDVIGVDLDPAVLPLSTIPLWHTPYALNPDLALVAD